MQAVYSSERYDDVPTCRCGCERGVDAEGTTCLECGTQVVRMVEDTTGIVTWMRAPRGVHALINPTMLVLLQDHFSIRRNQKEIVFDFMRWIMDPSYTVSTTLKKVVDIEAVVRAFHAAGLRRGYNAFIEQYDTIIELFIGHHAFGKDRDHRQALIQFLEHYRNCLFVKYVPTPPPSLLVLEVTATLTYRSDNTTQAINAIRQLLSCDTKETYRQSGNERLAMLAMFGMAKFNVDYATHTEKGKYGLWRMHIYAMRLQTSSFRAVIVPLYEGHRPDECKMPWAVMVKCLYYHLANLLDARGYSYPQIVKKLAMAVGFYDEEIHELLDLLMEQFKNDGEFPGPLVIMVRFPTLNTGNICAYFVTGFWLPWQGYSVAFPPTNVKAKNADFDGDKLTGWFALSLEDTRRWHQALGVHNNVVSPNGFRKPTGYFPLTRPLTTMLAGYMENVTEANCMSDEYMSRYFEVA